ncbi:hypothetical protein SCHPADRAFT_290004 [Schizopora paradoxa]|uniref:Uncharacterized protein n=1 Tax=Schizopora paradoxa TaxID=27342 RepID=A0A0H2SD50_9AGAM|nr:hypothetical protein SCHPADRAFT_290004 [Schizopora paradoxa]
MENHLNDHEAEVVEDGQKLINFQRYRSLSEKISKVLEYQDKLRGLASEPLNPELRDYLEWRIRSTLIDSKAKSELESRSMELCNKEAKMSRNRTTELVNVGFG